MAISVTFIVSVNSNHTTKGLSSSSPKCKKNASSIELNYEKFDDCGFSRFRDISGVWNLKNWPPDPDHADLWVSWSAEG